VDQVQDGLPPHILYKNIHKLSQRKHGSKPGREFYLVTRIETDMLQARFILERLKVSCGLDSGQRLLDLAQEMMKVLLSFWLARDKMIDYTSSLDWLVRCHTRITGKAVTDRCR
jgi:hypothetical protein